MSDKPSLDIVLSKFFKKDVFNFMNQFPEEFESIVVLTITDEKPICWRAAWVVQTFMEQDDERVQPYVDAILQIIPQKEDGHQREFLKILAQMNLNDDRESILYDECVAIWESVRKKPGTRYFAFQQMVKMVEKYPELMQEIHAVTQPQHINTLSPGVRQGVVKLIQQLNKDTYN